MDIQKLVELSPVKGEARVDSRLAEELGHKEAYQRVKQAIQRYAAGGLTLLPPNVMQ